jgi:hypothetical protein
MRIALLLPVSAVAVACGTTVIQSQTGSGAGGGTSSTSTTSTTTNSGGTGTGAWPGTGGGSSSGDCATDADCKGGTCAAVTPGGYKVCLNPPPEATMCNTPEPGVMDQCCKSADCMGSKCYLNSWQHQCSGPIAIPENQCASDLCTSDAMCGSQGEPQLCAPAGAFGAPVRVCFVAFCHTDADCKAKPGGVCVPVSQPCCQTPSGLGCVYPGGCRKDSDCGGMNQCQLDSKTGTGQCGPAPGCPL